MTLELDSQQPTVDEVEAVESIPSEESTASSDEVFVIKRTTFNYVVIAGVFLILGVVIGAMIAIPASRSATAEMISTAVFQAVRSSGAVGAAAPSGPAPVVNVSADDDPAWGPENAPVTIIEFSDFQCPFCGRFHQETYSRLRAAYEGQIRFVYRDFPILELHPNAEISAQAADCAEEQDAFWDFHDLLLTNQDKSSRSDLGEFASQLGLDMDAFNQCLDSGHYQQEVAKDVQDGSSYGVRGTPTFFINGQPLVGAQPYEVFAAAIDAALANAQQSSSISSSP